MRSVTQPSVVWRVPLSLYHPPAHTVPIILRLFHECTESWYWWGDEYCDHVNYKAAWNYTRWYFSEKSGLKNILYVYAPAKVSETEVVSH